MGDSSNLILKEQLQEILNRNKKLRKVRLTKSEKEELLYDGIKIANVFRNIPISISKDNQNLRMTYINSSHPDLDVKDILGKRLDEAFSLNENVLKVMKIKQEALETGKPQNKKVNHPDEDIDNVYRMISEPIYNKSKKIVGVNSIFIDITEQEKLEQLLIHSEKLAEVGQFAAGVSHEFNNILANIMGKVDILLLKDKLNKIDLKSEVVNKLKEIKVEGHKAKKIAYDVMNISKPKGKKKKLYNVTKAINDILDIKHRELATQNITLVKEYHPVRKVKMTLEELEQIFLNLIINAQHAMKPKCGGELKITVKEVKEVKEEIEIRVSDTGIGMTKEEKQHIFDPFYSTKGDLTEDHLDIKGNGLGLTVTARIINNYNGSIQVESTKGEGTTFIIRLPIAEELGVKK